MAQSPATKIKMKAVAKEDLLGLVTAPTPSSRASRGATIVTTFLDTHQAGATVPFGSARERNAAAVSAANYVRANSLPVWVRKQGGGQGTELLLINLDLAGDAVNKAYTHRPRPGRKANGTKRR